MLLPLRWLLYGTGTAPEVEERNAGRRTKRKWPRAMRPRHIHWSDNVSLPSPAELAQAQFQKQIAEDDELIAMFASML